MISRPQAGFPVPASFNPADWFLDVISYDFRTEDSLVTSRSAIAAVCDSFALDDRVFDHLLLQQQHDDDDDVAEEAKKKRNALFQEAVAFQLLVRRGWREQTRNRSALTFKYLIEVVFSLIFGVCYWDLGRDQTSIQDRTGVLFFTAMNVAFALPIGVAAVIPAQLPVVNAERVWGLYSEFTYLLSIFVVNVPLETLAQMISASITYYMVNLRPGADHFVLFFAVLLVETLVGIGLGVALSASFSKPEMAGQVAPLVVVFFLIFAGYFLNENSIPIAIRWLKYLSFVRYAFQALAVNEFRGAHFYCRGPGASDLTCVTDGGLVLRQLNFDDVNIRTNIAILAAIVVLFNLLALVIFRLNHPRFLPWSTSSKKVTPSDGTG